MVQCLDCQKDFPNSRTRFYHARHAHRTSCIYCYKIVGGTQALHSHTRHSHPDRYREFNVSEQFSTLMDLDPAGRRRCALCSEIVPKGHWTMHVDGALHQRNLRAYLMTEPATTGESPRDSVQLDEDEDEDDSGVLNVSSASAHSYTRHSHLDRYREVDISEQFSTPADRAGRQGCTLCNKIIPKGHWTMHVDGAFHQRKLRAYVTTEPATTGEGPRDSVQLDEDDIDFGMLDISSAGTSRTLRISNTGFTAINFFPRITQPSTVGLFTLEGGSSMRKLASSDDAIIRIISNDPNHLRGRVEGLLELTFQVPAEATCQSVIMRRIVAHIVSIANARLFQETATAATAPRPKRRRERRGPYSIFHKGIRPELLSKVTWVNKLDTFEVPSSLVELFNRKGSSFEKLRLLRLEFMGSGLGPDTYTDTFQMMLWVEELQAQTELSYYDMEDISLVRQGKQYVLKVPGLAEKRPSVIRGDEFFVRDMNSDEIPFQGFCHVVDDMTIRLRFNDKFSIKPGRKYGIEFRLNRVVFRRMHQALQCKNAIDRIIFPSIVDILMPVSQAQVDRIEPHNYLISNNDAQLRAIASVVSMPPGCIPFIVYGPPGTGKTVTIVEAIQQLLDKNPSARILACAPSNAAADIIASRLTALGQDKMIRIVTASRNKKLIPRSVLPFTRINDFGNFTCPPIDELVQFQVVVSTCCNASVPYGFGMSGGHFTHIFVDEAGQASEPEVMIPIRTLAGPKTNIIISGDVMQLRPRIRSSLVLQLGLGKSFMERLMDRVVYDEVIGRDRTFVKLVKNYRSHPKILEFPNDKFYRNELLACAGPGTTERIVGRWTGLVNPKIPVVFHSVRGRDYRDQHSPSYFNPDEISVVMEHLDSLLTEPKLDLQPEDIAIVTPYRAQVSRIRDHIEAYAEETRVGSIEEFQGQESPVVIISTVRSSPDVIKFDLRHTLGFVADRRRFNVAVTRARSLLVIIGDPIVLALDPLWKEFINFVHINGCFKGSPIDWDPAEPVDHSANLVEQRKARCLSEMEELMQRTNEMDLAAQEESAHGYWQERAPFREDE